METDGSREVPNCSPDSAFTYQLMFSLVSVLCCPFLTRICLAAFSAITIRAGEVDALHVIVTEPFQIHESYTQSSLSLRQCSDQ